MGMRLKNYRIAWFITYFIKSLLISIIIIIALLYKLNFTSIIEIIICFILFISA